MKDLLIIKKKINRLRQEINERIAEGDELSDEDILSLSEHLDMLINQWYKHVQLRGRVGH
ncbi:aspartyl-phosphate phosphatase Spo0E family protein [Ruminiclostridium cellobioparum]|uniref:Spo0E like sporulation regulatory protein n=1 Tax=Ruminiclostridium cellobioparum subsp. termitidis CT1112 TaxID=1195236 RepID=S0FQZ6_RUMCE|nr:aspartyl-phosphate phosphatase Spo0E family protein [Ruminiclostridium cellobioparum]EMS74257.1 Spo0E like sporulation regulatory protein [Ruminiclostridium cellobioparum subsp. termitidis CT1112]